MHSWSLYITSLNSSTVYAVLVVGMFMVITVLLSHGKGVSLVNEPPSRLPNMAVTEDLIICMLCHAVQIEEHYMSDNGTNERCSLGLKLLHILCTIAGRN